VLLVLIGAHLAGWLPGFAVLEAAGSRLWRWLEPAGRAFLPVDSLPKALAIGALWGWLPCGLVYSALLWTTAHADPLFGGAAMLAFGLGTLPGMFAAGLLARGVLALHRRLVLRRAAALLIIVLGLMSGAVAVRGAQDATGTHALHR
jgi:sulfite exporter TauE/SafE